MKNMKFFLLNPMRGLAALWVFTFHYSFSKPFVDTWPRLHSFFKLGALGVPMFFVISGYCIVAAVRGSIDRGQHTRSFLYRRVKRIYPPFWCSIPVVCGVPYFIEAVSWLKTGTFILPTSADYGFLAYDLFEWLRLATLTQVFWPVEGAENLQAKFTSINSVYWTLALELQFYFVVGAAMRISPKHIYGLLLAVTVVCLPFTFTGTLYLSGLFVPYWPMFAMGSLLFFVLERGWSPETMGPAGKRLSVAVGLAMVAGFLVASAMGYRPTWEAFAGGFAAALWLLKPIDARMLAASENGPWRWSLAPLVVLGAMSYSLYLLHTKLQFVSAQFVRQVIPVGTIPYDAAVIFATCVACWLFYWRFEKPFFNRIGSRAVAK